MRLVHGGAHFFQRQLHAGVICIKFDDISALRDQLSYESTNFLHAGNAYH